MPTIAKADRVGRAELLDFVRPRHRVLLVTRRGDSSPQISPVTAGLGEDGALLISTYPRRAKTANIRRDERVSACVLSDEFNGPWVQLDGRAEVVDAPESIEPLVAYFRSVSGEHPDWAEYRGAMAVQEKSLLRITIERWGPIATGGFPADVAARMG